MGAQVAWFEITSSAPEGLVAFYRSLFGWTISGGPEPGYWLIDTDGPADAVAGGIGSSEDGGGVTIYVRVDDLAATLEQATSMGGSIIVGTTPLPGDWGTFAVLADPDGHTIGLWS